MSLCVNIIWQQNDIVYVNKGWECIMGNWKMVSMYKTDSQVCVTELPLQSYKGKGDKNRALTDAGLQEKQDIMGVVKH